MGMTASNLSFGEVNRRFYGRKFRFTATRQNNFLNSCQIFMKFSVKCKVLCVAFKWQRAASEGRSGGWRGQKGWLAPYIGLAGALRPTVENIL